MTDKGPITQLVDLARRFTCEEWERAAFKAAHDNVSNVCAQLAALRRNDDFVAVVETPQATESAVESTKEGD